MMNEFISAYLSIITEDYNKHDKGIVARRNPDEIKQRIKFWERKKKEVKGNPKKVKICDEYLKYLRNALNSVENEKKEEEKPVNEVPKEEPQSTNEEEPSEESPEDNQQNPENADDSDEMTVNVNINVNEQ